MTDEKYEEFNKTDQGRIGLVEPKSSLEGEEGQRKVHFSPVRISPFSFSAHSHVDEILIKSFIAQSDIFSVGKLSSLSAYCKYIQSERIPSHLPVDADLALQTTLD